MEVDPEVDVVLMEKLTLLLVHEREPLPLLFVRCLFQVENDIDVFRLILVCNETSVDKDRMGEQRSNFLFETSHEVLTEPFSVRVGPKEACYFGQRAIVHAARQKSILVQFRYRHDQTKHRVRAELAPCRLTATWSMEALLASMERDAWLSGALMEETNLHAIWSSLSSGRPSVVWLAGFMLPLNRPTGEIDRGL